MWGIKALRHQYCKASRLKGIKAAIVFNLRRGPDSQVKSLGLVFPQGLWVSFTLGSADSISFFYHHMPRMEWDSNRCTDSSREKIPSVLKSMQSMPWKMLLALTVV